MKYLQLTIREPAESRNPMHSFVMEHDDTSLAQLWNWNTTAADVDVLLFRVFGPPDPYTAALDDTGFVSEYATTRLDDASFYVYLEHETRDEDRAFRDPFLTQQVLPVPPIEFTETGEVRMELIGRPGDIQTVLDDFPPGFAVQVTQITAYKRGFSTSPALLTDRQHEVLSVAVEQGYYEVPRTATVEDLAAELNCAASTVSLHLQKAHARLARNVAGQSTGVRP